MKREAKKELWEKLACFLIIGILFVLLYFVHDHVIFMMDDEWYSTNLVTGEALTGVSDVVESQIWHYFNWGGRSITHGILQLTLMSGEFCADMLNMLAMVMLIVLICMISGKCDAFTFALAGSLLISLNPNIKTSMFWQAGVVNYVYSTAWILLFLWIYIQGVRKEHIADGYWLCLPAAALGLITGWSNENMGPASCIFAVAVILYRRFIMKKTSPLWMHVGAVVSFLGSVICILAPGNFVRSAEIESLGLLQTLYQRLVMMLQAGTEFLMPSILLSVVLGGIYIRYHKRGFWPEYVMLGGMAALAFGAMALSPHFPDRASFGVMCLLIIVSLYMLQELMNRFAALKRIGFLLLICSFCLSVYELSNIILLQ